MMFYHAIIPVFHYSNILLFPSAPAKTRGRVYEFMAKDERAVKRNG
jgi:hypothetical protein